MVDDYRVYAAMETGEPLAVFKKTIVGKVYITALDPFSGKPVGLHLEGNQDAGDERAFIEIYDEKGLVFFKKINKRQFDLGNIIEVKEAPEPIVSPNQLSDEEVEELLDSKLTPFLKLQARLNEFTEVAPVLRLLNRARELDKSEKLIGHIEKRMSDIEINKYEKD